MVILQLLLKTNILIGVKERILKTKIMEIYF